MDRFNSTNQSIDQNSALGPQVYQLLKQGIVEARFRPGDRASEVEIARQFEVSRQPIREAIIRLRAEGMLDIRPQCDTYIQKFLLREILTSSPAISRENPNFFDSTDNDIVSYSAVALPPSTTGDRNVS